MTTYDSLDDIRKAVDSGKTVYWMHKGYKVMKDPVGQYLIHCTMNGDYVGLDSCGNPKAYYSE